MVQHKDHLIFGCVPNVRVKYIMYHFIFFSLLNDNKRQMMHNAFHALLGTYSLLNINKQKQQECNHYVILCHLRFLLENILDFKEINRKGIEEIVYFFRLTGPHRFFQINLKCLDLFPNTILFTHWTKFLHSVI